MKKLLLFLTLIFCFFNISAQDIILTFDGKIQDTGVNAPLDIVTIENLTRGGSIELTNSFTINLSGALGINDVVPTNSKKGFQKIYPNPFNEVLNVEFYSEGQGTTTLSIYNILGQEIVSYPEALSKGNHKFTFSPKTSGVYFISLYDNGEIFTKKVISNQVNNPEIELLYIEKTKTIESNAQSRSAMLLFFEIGDVLRFTGKSGSSINTIYSSPIQSELITFNFADRFFRFEHYLTESNIPSFVDIMFSVTDENFKGVDYLTSDDFIVFENGNTVSPTESFRYVKKLDQIPYSQKTVIMLDNSASVAGVLPQIKAAAMALVNQIVEGQQISIYSFSDNPVLLQDFTSNVIDLENAINSISTGFPSTNLYGSLITGLNSFTNNYTLDAIEEGYLIAFTDGDDTQASSTLAQVIAARGRKKVFMVGLGNEINPTALNQIQNTGSSFIPISTADALEEIFKEIQLDIIRFSNSFYWLNYMSPKRNGIHTLRIEAVNNSNTGTDSFIDSNFNANGFQSVFSGVHVNISPENIDGVDWVSWNSTDTNNIDLSAVTYWATSVPVYAWSIDNETIAKIEVNPFDNSKATLIKQTTVARSTTTITLTDIANNFTKEIIVYITGDSPTILTKPAETITTTSAVLSGEIIDEGNSNIIERGINLSTTSGIIGNDIIDSGIGTREFSITATALSGGTTYFVRAYAINSSGLLSYGNEIILTTNTGLPSVNTLTITNITTTSAFGGGQVTDSGGLTLLAKGLVWSTSTSPTLSDNFTNESGLSTVYSSSMTNLLDNTTYYVRAYATNSFGTGFGNEVLFNTLNFIFNGDITLTTQQEVDTFGSAGHTQITGNLHINSNNTNSITNLNALSGLNSIGGLNVSLNPALLNLNGLNNLTDITILNGIGININSNNSLTSLIELSNITLLNGQLRIIQNNALINLNGLENITSIGGVLWIDSNSNLENLNALSNVTSASSILILGNPSLVDLNGLSAITSSVSRLEIGGNTLIASLNGLENITTVVNQLIIGSNPNLTSINSLPNITSIGGNLEISDNSLLSNLDGLNNIISLVGRLTITDNNALVNIDALSNLTSIGNFLIISNNELLTNIDGLSSLTSIGSSIIMENNSTLTNLNGLSLVTNIGFDATVINNTILIDLCGLRPLFLSGNFNGNYTVNGNAYNPTLQNIIDGNCSQ